MSEADNQSPASYSSSPAPLRHSLRTPLNHVIGYTEMLLEDVAGEAGLRTARPSGRLNALSTRASW